MSYQLRKRRRALGGLTSQPPGRAVSRYALGAAAIEYTPAIAIPVIKTPPPPAKVVGRKGGALVRHRARAMGGLTSQPPGRPISVFALGSLGDVPDGSSLATPTLAQPTIDNTWQQQMLAGQQAMLKQLQGDRLQKWVQIGVTASIPLFGAIWKMIFKAGER